MSTILIRQLDEATKVRLRLRAAQHGRSMEAEAREILKTTLTGQTRARRGLADRIHARFSALGGVNLPKVPRDAMRPPPAFDE
jgi:plasmid stability protein